MVRIWLTEEMLRDAAILLFVVQGFKIQRL
jgi:hypothetical protein